MESYDSSSSFDADDDQLNNPSDGKEVNWCIGEKKRFLFKFIADASMSVEKEDDRMISSSSEVNVPIQLENNMFN